MGPAARNTAQFPIAGHIRGAIPCNWPRTKNLKRHLTFWPAPFLKAALKARSRNERRDADNYKTVAMGYPESSSPMNRWPWTRWSRHQQTCGTVLRGSATRSGSTCPSCPSIQLKAPVPDCSRVTGNTETEYIRLDSLPMNGLAFTNPSSIDFQLRSSPPDCRREGRFSVLTHCERREGHRSAPVNTHRRIIPQVRRGLSATRQHLDILPRGRFGTLGKWQRT